MTQEAATPAEKPKRVRPTLTSKLSEAQAHLASATARIEDLENQLKAVKNLYQYASQTRDQLNADLEQVHIFLDHIPGVLGRQVNEFTRHAAITRMATWMGLYLVPVNLAMPLPSFDEEEVEEEVPVDNDTTHATTTEE